MQDILTYCNTNPSWNYRFEHLFLAPQLWIPASIMAFIIYFGLRFVAYKNPKLKVILSIIFVVILVIIFYGLLIITDDVSAVQKCYN